VIALSMAAVSATIHLMGGERTDTASHWAQALDWQPALARADPWRAWTAVFIHLSDLHLAANLAGAVAVAAWGAVARVPARCSIAWFIAWPLTQWGLTMQPELRHYGGLSGVLHAGVSVVAVHLACSGTRAQRRIAAVVLAALAAKLLSEMPWAGAISHPPGWDIAVAPGAHLSGALSGAMASALLEGVSRAVATVREALGMVDAHG
jgi:rhomboid family GlyGly-CTERM serine protease